MIFSAQSEVRRSRSDWSSKVEVWVQSCSTSSHSPSAVAPVASALKEPTLVFVHGSHELHAVQRLQTQSTPEGSGSSNALKHNERVTRLSTGTSSPASPVAAAWRGRGDIRTFLLREAAASHSGCRGPAAQRHPSSWWTPEETSAAAGPSLFSLWSESPGQLLTHKEDYVIVSVNSRDFWLNRIDLGISKISSCPTTRWAQYEQRLPKTQWKIRDDSFLLINGKTVT